MSAVLDLTQAHDDALRERRARNVLASPLGPLLRELIADETGMRYTRGDTDGTVYRIDLTPLAADADLYELNGRGGHAVTGRTGGAR